MSEIDQLISAFQAMRSGFDAPVEALVENIPDEGQVGDFLNFIKAYSPSEQAAFLSDLGKFREECKPALLELMSSSDESASINAAAGLLNFEDCRQMGINLLKVKALERINNDSLNKGDWPLHFIVDFLIQDGSKDSMESAREILLEVKSKVSRDAEGFKGMAKLIGHYI